MINKFADVNNMKSETSSTGSGSAGRSSPFDLPLATPGVPHTPTSTATGRSDQSVCLSVCLVQGRGGLARGREALDGALRLIYRSRRQASLTHPPAPPQVRIKFHKILSVKILQNSSEYDMCQTSPAEFQNVQQRTSVKNSIKCLL